MKRALTVALLALSVIIVAEPVLAGPGGGSGGQWETISTTLQSLVSSIGELLDFTDIENGETVVRGAFFLLLFIMFYAAGIRAFGQLTTKKSEGKETTWAAVTAFLISLIVVILTPPGLIVTFLSQFGIFFWVALYFILYAGVLWFLYVFIPSFVGSDEKGKGINKFGARLLSGARVLFSLLAISMLQEFEGSFVRVSSSGLPQANLELLRTILNQMNGYILILFSIILIYELFRLFTAGAADERFKNDSSGSIFSGLGSSASNAASNAADRTKDMANSGYPSIMGDNESDAADELEDLEDDEKENLDEASDDVETINDDVQQIEEALPYASDAFESLRELYQRILQEANAPDGSTQRIARWADEFANSIDGSSDHSPGLDEVVHVSSSRITDALENAREVQEDLEATLSDLDDELTVIDEVESAEIEALRSLRDNNGAEELRKHLNDDYLDYEDERRALAGEADRVAEALPESYSVEKSFDNPVGAEPSQVRSYGESVLSKYEEAIEAYEGLINSWEELEAADKEYVTNLRNTLDLVNSYVQQLSNLRASRTLEAVPLPSEGDEPVTIGQVLRSLHDQARQLADAARNAQEVDELEDAISEFQGIGPMIADQENDGILESTIRNQLHLIETLNIEDLEDRLDNLLRQEKNQRATREQLEAQKES